MDLKLFLVRALRAVRRDGISRTFNAAISYVSAKHARDPFDSRYGTDTNGVLPLWKFKIDSPNAKFGWRYETTDFKELEHCLQCIPGDPRRLTFIDMGCGKGRVLIAAGLLGFRKLIGVEFVPELARIARTNLAKAGVKNAVIANTDAADFHFPSEEFVLYLFNPFSEEVMRKVLDNLREAFPARSFIIYNNARCAELFDSSTFLGRVGSVSGTRYPTLVWSIQTPPTGLTLASKRSHA